MRNRLFIGLAALLVCGANVAVAQHQGRQARFACVDFDCDSTGDCNGIGCGDCGDTPNGKKRCKAASEIE
jgi:hypothetical protein